MKNLPSVDNNGFMAVSKGSSSCGLHSNNLYNNSKHATPTPRLVVKAPPIVESNNILIFFYEKSEKKTNKI